MDFATGAIGTLIPKLGTLLKDEFSLQKGVKGGIKRLMTELESMEAYLEKVSSVPVDQLDKNARLWAREVRELSYDIEDRIDTFLVRVEGKKTETVHTGIKGFIAWTSNLLSKVMIRHELAEDIKDIMARVKDAKERHNRYKVDKSLASSTIKSDPRLQALYKKVTQLVGVDEKRVELINMLNKGDDEVSKKKLKSISVVGVGGLGKTTLAKALYDKIKVEFECCAFVSVGQNPEVKKVLKDILLELDKQRFNDIHNLIRDEKQLIDLILAFLGNKRYFLVIDDIWDIQSWAIIKLALAENNCGSRIITTTRKYEVAVEGGDVYKLAPLSYDNSKRLLCTRISDGEGECPDNQLDELLDKILKKCGGVPLAIITMASLLAGKPRKEWFEVFNSIGFGQKDSRHLDNTMRILSFSYYDMPFHLRTCLLYLSVFPEDYFIPKDHLIWMWIAEGFVQRVQGVGLFELGESYSNDLANRSMIQPIMEFIEDGTQEIGFRVHDMVLALIRSLSCEENFVTILDNEQDATLLPCNNVRRISQQKNAPHGSWKDRMDMTQVRSFIAFSVFDQIDNSVPLSSFKVLRVLVLEIDLSWWWRFKNRYCLKHLGYLIHLRYLRVSGIDELPEEIVALKFLQTLDLEYSSVSLSSSIGHLTQLVCLRNNSDIMCCFVDGIIGNLKSLEELTLSTYSDGNGKSAWGDLLTELGNLTSLRVLNIQHFDDIDEGTKDASLESLRNLQKLHKLSLHLSSRRFAFFRQEAPGFALSRQLQYLVLEKCEFPRMPTWIDSSLLPNLTHLSIRVRFLCHGDMRILGRLPELHFLDLRTGSSVVVYGAEAGFLKLRSCKLYAADGAFMFWRDEYGTPPMPSLEYLDLFLYVAKWKHLCARHGQGILFLPTVFGFHNMSSSLAEIRVGLWCQGAREGEVNETEVALQHAARTHPNHPSIQIYRLNYPELMTSPQYDEHCKSFDFHVHVRELNDMGYAFDFTSLSYFPSLEQVLARTNCEDATLAEVEVAITALRRAVDIHPNHPTLQVERYSEDKMKPCKSFDFHVHVRELNDMGYAFDFTNLSDLPSLEQVLARTNCEDARPGEVEVAIAALRHAVDVHPNHPTLQVERYSEDKMKLAKHTSPAIGEVDASTATASPAGVVDASTATASPAGVGKDDKQALLLVTSPQSTSSRKPSPDQRLPKKRKTEMENYILE